ncbi:D-lactate dehydrogenase (acceptor) [Candidatus Tiddalikarchaeum anstoanum]|nr:D-lactate dehydrogenase (acceptor) [Candidatus Tiddalikarchaeum anstoanum]
MHLSEFESIVGKENLNYFPNTKLVYSSDASMYKGNPLVVLWPETIEQIQKIVMIAKKNFLDITTRGGGTGLVGGAVPKRSIVLNMSKMNKILDFDNDSILVEAGIVLDDLNMILSQKGLYFPIIPSSHEVCTIGGMISCNASGKRAVKYGSTKNYINYLEVVDGSGAVRKVNDVEKFCGTEGTVGIIVNAELKLEMLPKKISMDVFKFDRATDMSIYTPELKEKPQLLSLELLDPKTSSMLNLEERYHLIAEYENSLGEIREPEEIEKWDSLRDSAYSKIAGLGYSLIEDPEILDDEKLAVFMKYLEGLNVPFFGHVGIGILHPCFKQGTDLADFFKTVESLGGSVTGEHGIGLAKKKYTPKIMRDKLLLYKKSFDPSNILNRGKII